MFLSDDRQRLMKKDKHVIFTYQTW